MQRLLTCILFVITASLTANNITVSNTVLTLNTPTNNDYTVSFDVAWENSWNLDTGPENHDAAWVFVKYRVNGGDWRHMPITSMGATPFPSYIDILDNTGVMISNGFRGNFAQVNYQNVELIWSPSSPPWNPQDIIDIKVFAIEMVYVPEGSFYVGDGTDNFAEFYEGGTSLSPFQITSEGEITIGNTVGSLNYIPNLNSSGDGLGPIPATFPKGYDGFYCMKYELSQGQYVEFFNTLPAAVRDDFDPTRTQTGKLGKGTDDELNRNGCSYTGGDLSTTLPNVPMNYVNQVQSLAYLDWAGLRPITELEFEKAARGPVFPIPDDHPWGNISSSNTANFLYADRGTASARITNLPTNIGNMINDLDRNEVNGPHRCGILAASAVNSTRQESGGSYYGIMEMAGNLWERVVTVGTPLGRTYVGNHGDGTLATDGTANVQGWPDGTQPAFGIRAGAYVSAAERCTISSRRNAAGNRNRADHDYHIFRGIRTYNVN